MVRWFGRVPAEQQVPVRVVGNRRHPSTGLGFRQFVSGVVGAGGADPLLIEHQTVANRIVCVCDVIGVRAAPLLVCQLVNVVIGPGHAVAGRFYHVLAVTHGVEHIGEAREVVLSSSGWPRAAAGSALSYEIRSARRIGIVDASDAAGGVVAPGRSLGLRIDHEAGPAVGVEDVGKASGLGIDQVFPPAGGIVGIVMRRPAGLITALMRPSASYDVVVRPVASLSRVRRLSLS